MPGNILEGRPRKLGQLPRCMKLFQGQESFLCKEGLLLHSEVSEKTEEQPYNNSIDILKINLLF